MGTTEWLGGQDGTSVIKLRLPSMGDTSHTHNSKRQCMVVLSLLFSPHECCLGCVVTSTSHIHCGQNRGEWLHCNMGEPSFFEVPVLESRKRLPWEVPQSLAYVPAISHRLGGCELGAVEEHGVRGQVV
jgi:hypothetical protein